jgi:hypothetical protein
MTWIFPGTLKQSENNRFEVRKFCFAARYRTHLRVKRGPQKLAVLKSVQKELVGTRFGGVAQLVRNVSEHERSCL